MLHPIYYRRFRVNRHRARRIRIDAEAIASQLPEICAGFDAAAADYRANPVDRDCIRAFVEAICALCVCIFGQENTERILDGWNGNYVGLAAELTDFCTRRLAPILRRHAVRHARRYRRGRCL